MNVAMRDSMCVHSLDFTRDHTESLHTLPQGKRAGHNGVFQSVAIDERSR